MRFFKTNAPYLFVAVLAAVVLLLSLLYTRRIFEQSLISLVEETMGRCLNQSVDRLQRENRELEKFWDGCRKMKVRLELLPVRDTILLCAKQPDWLLPGTYYPDDYTLTEIRRRFGNNFSGLQIPIGMVTYLRRFGDTPEKQREAIHRYLKDDADAKKLRVALPTAVRAFDEKRRGKENQTGPGRNPVFPSATFVRLSVVRGDGCYRYHVRADGGTKNIPLLVCQRVVPLPGSEGETVSGNPAFGIKPSIIRIVTFNSLEQLRTFNNALYLFGLPAIGFLLLLIGIALPLLLEKGGWISIGNRYSRSVDGDISGKVSPVENLILARKSIALGPYLSVEFSDPESSAETAGTAGSVDPVDPIGTVKPEGQAERHRRSYSTIHRLGGEEGRFVCFFSFDALDAKNRAEATAALLETSALVNSFSSVVLPNAAPESSSGREAEWPERWLDNVCIHLQAKERESGKGPCLLFVAGILDLESGMLYTMSGGNLPPAILREGEVFYIEDEGKSVESPDRANLSGEAEERRILIFRLAPADVIVIGSGLLHRFDDSDPGLKISQEEDLRHSFSRLVAGSEGRPNKIIRELRKQFDIQTELSLLRIGYQEQQQRPTAEKELTRECREIIERAVACLGSGSPGEAENELRKIEDSFQEHHDVRRVWIRILLARQDYRQCRTVLEGYLKGRPWETELLYALAVCYRKTDLPERALQMIRVVLLREPVMSKALLLQGEIYRDFGAKMKVREIVDRLQAVDPHYEGIRRLTDSA